MNFMKIAAALLCITSSGFSHAMVTEDKTEKPYVESEEQIAEKNRFLEHIRMVKAVSVSTQHPYAVNACLPRIYVESLMLERFFNMGAANNFGEGFLDTVSKKVDSEMFRCLEKQIEAQQARTTQQ